ncbi:MAG: hypothetical protein R3A52_19685 [Polyangiales bacterium]
MPRPPGLVLEEHRGWCWRSTRAGAGGAPGLVLGEHQGWTPADPLPMVREHRGWC